MIDDHLKVHVYGPGRSDWRLVLNTSSRFTTDAIVRGRSITDPSGVTRRRRTADEILKAVGPGKCLALGLVWDGDIKPAIDMAIEAMQPLVNGLTIGRTLNAETSHAGLDLGRRWLGEIEDKMAVALAPHRANDSDVEISSVLSQLAMVESCLTTNGVGLGDALKGLKRAADSIPSKRKPTNDMTTWLARSKDHAAREIAKITAAAARTIWPTSTPAKTTDAQSSDADLRDARNAFAQARTLEAMRKAPNAATQIEALNAANRAFWKGRTADQSAFSTRGANILAARSPSDGSADATGVRTPDDINDVNRAFWDAQKRK